MCLISMYLFVIAIPLQLWIFFDFPATPLFQFRSFRDFWRFLFWGLSKTFFRCSIFLKRCLLLWVLSNFLLPGRFLISHCNRVGNTGDSSSDFDNISKCLQSVGQVLELQHCQILETRKLPSFLPRNGLKEIMPFTMTGAKSVDLGVNWRMRVNNRAIASRRKSRVKFIVVRECAMNIRHVAVLVAQRVLSREWVENRPSRLLGTCYVACGRIVDTTGPFPWVPAVPSVKTNVHVQWIYGMWLYCWQYGSCPLSECTRTVKPRVIVQLIYGMWPFWWHYGYSPVSVFTSSVNPSVNVQWIYGIGPYCWHYAYWPVSECSTIRQV